MRNILRNSQCVGDLLHGIEPGELSNAHTHGVARMDETVGARENPAVSSIRISRRPIYRAIDFSGSNRAIANRSARQQPVGKSDRINERLECRTNLPIY